MTPPLFYLYGIIYHISNVYNIFDMTPPLFSLYGSIIYQIYTTHFIGTPTHVLCIPMLRARMINQPCCHVYKEMRFLKTKC